MQIAVTWAFFDAHWQTVTSKLSEGLAGDIAWAVAVLRGRSQPRRRRQAGRAGRGIDVAVDRVPEGPQAADRPPRRRCSRPWTARCSRPWTTGWTTRSGSIPPATPPISTSACRSKDGVLQIYALRDRAFATQGHIFILWMVVATMLLTAVAILFIRNQVRAIERLADAADAFGRGIDHDFKPHGAREVRQAARPSWP
jgi:two-component system osmolarity sensor histidine kinase EnvZ